MTVRPRAARHYSRCATAFVLTCIVEWSAAVALARPQLEPGRVRPWPCRLVVPPNLLRVVEETWARSPTLQRQCRELADARSVVVIEWGTSDSHTRAITHIGTDAAGIVIATVSVPPVSHVIELVAHELEHVIEGTHGLDLAAESRRRGSGVWKAFGGFESQRAIDAGRQVAKEVGGGHHE